ncbi:MAG: hypothetical protein IIU58_01415, partial [Clostridia bacterium]|nr:hypothetical protein [Clostridia bacterium]
ETEGEDLPEIGLVIDYYAELSKKAMDLIGRRVKINHKGAAKSISVSFEDNEDLEILLKKLCGDDILE